MSPVQLESGPPIQPGQCGERKRRLISVRGIRGWEDGEEVTICTLPANHEGPHHGHLLLDDGSVSPDAVTRWPQSNSVGA